MQPKSHGLGRLLPAGRYAAQGLRRAWHEPAFRLEALLVLVLFLACPWVAQGWLEAVILIALAVAVLVVELLNTAIEATVDRIGLEHHPLSKQAKDLASAAVLLSLLVCGGAWASALWRLLTNTAVG